MQCPRCEGTGKCSDCGGEGFVVCLACEGSGERSSSRGGTYPCRSCKGKGKLDCTLICMSCEGSGEITQQLQEKVRDKYLVRFDNTLPAYRVTTALIMVCVVLYLLGEFNPAGKGWLFLNLANRSGLWEEPWRLLSSAFLHFGPVHLATNMVTLFRYGPWLEGLYGHLRFLLLYLFSALCGAALSSWAHPAFQNQIVLSAGASGAIFGVYGAICGAHYKHGFFQRPQVNELMTTLLIYTAILMSATSQVDHWCHAGGFLGGFAYAWLTRRPTGR